MYLKPGLVVYRKTRRKQASLPGHGTFTKPRKFAWETFPQWHRTLWSGPYTDNWHQTISVKCTVRMYYYYFPSSLPSLEFDVRHLKILFNLISGVLAHTSTTWVGNGYGKLSEAWKDDGVKNSVAETLMHSLPAAAQARSSHRRMPAWQPLLLVPLKLTCYMKGTLHSKSWSAKTKKM